MAEPGNRADVPLARPLPLDKTDEMRRAIEDMKPEEYRRLGYFDKWAVGISTLVVEKGLVPADEIARRVGDISARLGETMRRPNDVGGLPAGPIGPRGHGPEPWERLLTALVSTVGPAKAKINCIDEFRRARRGSGGRRLQRVNLFPAVNSGLHQPHGGKKKAC